MNLHSIFIKGYNILYKNVPITAAATAFFKAISNIGLDSSLCISIRCKPSATIEDWPRNEFPVFAGMLSMSSSELDLKMDAHRMLLRRLKRQVPDCIQTFG
jgi:hypothetical protein